MKLITRAKYQITICFFTATQENANQLIFLWQRKAKSTLLSKFSDVRYSFSNRNTNPSFHKQWDRWCNMYLGVSYQYCGKVWPETEQFDWDFLAFHLATLLDQELPNQDIFV